MPDVRLYLTDTYSPRATWRRGRFEAREIGKKESEVSGVGLYLVGHE